MSAVTIFNEINFIKTGVTAAPANVLATLRHVRDVLDASDEAALTVMASQAASSPSLQIALNDAAAKMTSIYRAAETKEVRDAAFETLRALIDKMPLEAAAPAGPKRTFNHPANG